jgi:hypothetical protein
MPVVVTRSAVLNAALCGTSGPLSGLRRLWQDPPCAAAAACVALHAVDAHVVAVRGVSAVPACCRVVSDSLKYGELSKELETTTTVSHEALS